MYAFTHDVRNLACSGRTNINAANIVLPQKKPHVCMRRSKNLCRLKLTATHACFYILHPKILHVMNRVDRERTEERTKYDTSKKFLPQSFTYIKRL